MLYAANSGNPLDADLEEEMDEVIETDPDEEDHHPIVDDDALPPVVRARRREHVPEQRAPHGASPVDDEHLPRAVLVAQRLSHERVVLEDHVLWSLREGTVMNY